MSDQFMIGIDSVDRLFKMCEEHICKKNGWVTPGDEAHGKGWALVRNTWEQTMHKIVMQGVPVINIVHEKVEEQQINRTKVNRVMMNLPRRAKEVVADSSDFIFYFGLNEKDERTMFCKPTMEHEVGRRGSGDLDMSPMEPTYEALNERIYKETGSDIPELAPMVTVMGRPKIGKTTFLSEFPDTVLFDCENGSKFLRKKFKKVYLCRTWMDFINGLKETFNEGDN